MEGFCPDICQQTLEEMTVPVNVKTAAQDFKKHEKLRKHDTTKGT